MQRELKLHPLSQCDAVETILVNVFRSPSGLLVLDYCVSGATDSLRIPPMMMPARADELWQHTCLEAFVGNAGEASYCEINFSPSGEWAAYRFDSYRSGMRAAGEIAAPAIEMDASARALRLRATVALNGMRDENSALPWRLGLSAVIEEKNGRKSWWALAHPPGKPDFHHPDCFALELAGAFGT